MLGADGVLHLPKLVPAAAIDAYCEQFTHDAAARAGSADALPAELAVGYGYGPPDLTNPTLRAVCLDAALVGQVEAVLGAPAVLHHVLTGWASVFRDWHQDRYLDPLVKNVANIGAWIALADVSPDDGPFEYVRGSHCWPPAAQAVLLEALAAGVTSVPVEQFLPAKGDVLLWDPDLVHHGAAPAAPTVLRRALIGHYAAR